MAMPMFTEFSCATVMLKYLLPVNNNNERSVSEMREALHGHFTNSKNS